MDAGECNKSVTHVLYIVVNLKNIFLIQEVFLLCKKSETPVPYIIHSSTALGSSDPRCAVGLSCRYAIDFFFPAVLLSIFTLLTLLFSSVSLFYLFLFPCTSFTFTKCFFSLEI